MFNAAHTVMLLSLLGTTAPQANDALRLDAEAPRRQRAVAPFLVTGYERVRHDLLLARPSVPVEDLDDDLGYRRELDRVLLLEDRPGLRPQSALGPALFETMVVLAAHSPLRAPFDGRVHLGPAVFDGGGMGVGLGGRFL